MCVIINNNVLNALYISLKPHSWRVCVSASRCRLITSNYSSKPSTSCSNSSVQEEEIMATLLASESPCTGGKRRNCNSNIVTKFTASKITGQGFSRGTQVRETMRFSTVKICEPWSTETRDWRLELCLKMKTLLWPPWAVALQTA